MQEKAKGRKPRTAERIARVADQGKDVSRFFTNRGVMMQPIQRLDQQKIARRGKRSAA